MMHFPSRSAVASTLLLACLYFIVPLQFVRSFTTQSSRQMHRTGRAYHPRPCQSEPLSCSQSLPQLHSQSQSQSQPPSLLRSGHSFRGVKTTGRASTRCFSGANDGVSPLFLTTLNTTDEWSRNGKGDKKDGGYAQEAELLKDKAKKLWAEARALEASMMARKLSSSSSSSAAAAASSSSSNQPSSMRIKMENLVELTFTSNSTPTRVAESIRQRRITPDKLVVMMDILYDRLVVAQGRGSRSTIASGTFQIGDVRNSAEPDHFETERLERWIEMLLEAAQTLDNDFLSGDKGLYRWDGRTHFALKSHLNGRKSADEKAMQRIVEGGALSSSSSEMAQGSAANVSSVDGQEGLVTSYIRKTFGFTTNNEVHDRQQQRPTRAMNATRLAEQMAKIPPWIPYTLLPSILSCDENLDPNDLKRIQEEVLLGSEFFLTSTESIRKAAIFRGNVRSISGSYQPDMARNKTKLIFHNLQAKMDKLGLSDRIQLFFLHDLDLRYEKRPLVPKPMILAVPKAVTPLPANTKRRWFTTALSVSVHVSNIEA